MGTVGDFLSSLFEAVKFRVTTSIVATYVFFWVAMHWQGFYTALFVDQEAILIKYKMLKNEYIETYFFGFHPDQVWFWTGYVLPAVAAIVFIWVLPRFVFLPAFKVERKYKLERKLVILENDRAYEKAKASVVKQRAQRKKAEVAVVQAEQIIEEADPTKVYEREYMAFRRRPRSRQVLEELKECIYDYNGYLKVPATRTANGAQYKIDTDTLAVSHANELVDIIASNTSLGDKLQLTQKGKYFIAQLN
jgi:hypothetical protein